MRKKRDRGGGKGWPGVTKAELQVLNTSRKIHHGRRLKLITIIVSKLVALFSS